MVTTVPNLTAVRLVVGCPAVRVVVGCTAVRVVVGCPAVRVVVDCPAGLRFAQPHPQISSKVNIFAGNIDEFSGDDV